MKDTRFATSLLAAALLAACAMPPPSYASRQTASYSPDVKTSLAPIAFRVAQAVGRGPAGDVCPQIATDGAGNIYEASDREIARLSTLGVVRWVRPLAEGARIVAIANSSAGAGTAALVIDHGAPAVARIDPSGAISWISSLKGLGTPAGASLVTDPAGGVVAALSFAGSVVLRALDNTGKPTFAREWDDANDALVSRTPSGETFVIARRDASNAYRPKYGAHQLRVPRRESHEVRLAAITRSGKPQWDYAWHASTATMALVALDGYVVVAASASAFEHLSGSPLMLPGDTELFLPIVLELVVYPDSRLDTVEYMRAAGSFYADSARIDAMTRGCDGYTWLEGTMDNDFGFGPYEALNPRLDEVTEANACGRFLAIRDADGDPAWVHELATELPCDATSESMATLPGGGVVLTVAHRGPLALDVAGDAPRRDAGAAEACTILRFPGVPPPSTARMAPTKRQRTGTCERYGSE